MRETEYNIPGAPRIALLSDLHNVDPAPVLQSLRVHGPEMIAITGDVLYGSRPENDRSPLETQTNVLPFLSGCASLAPTYMSLGNHELFLDHADLERVASTGVVVLDNCWVNQSGLVIGGLTSGYVTDYRRFRATQDGSVRYPGREDISGIGGGVAHHDPDTAWLVDFSAATGYKVLLSHHPEYYSIIPSTVDLILSGHAHGGQIRLFNHGLWCPGQGFLPRWTRGMYDGKLVVSAGLSNTTWVPRIWNPTEIVYLE